VLVVVSITFCCGLQDINKAPVIPILLKPEENRGMRVNINKTKVMIRGERQKVTEKAVRWL